MIASFCAALIFNNKLDKKRSNTLTYAIVFLTDHVFGNESDNSNVYQNVASQIVTAAMEGFNGNIQLFLS